MASAHDTVSDGSVIGAEFRCFWRLFRPESDSYLSTRLIDTADSSLPATTGYHKIQLQEALFNFRFLGNMNISSTELFSDIHKLHKAIKQIQINRRSSSTVLKYNRG